MSASGRDVAKSWLSRRYGVAILVPIQAQGRWHLIEDRGRRRVLRLYWHGDERPAGWEGVVQGKRRIGEGAADFGRGGRNDGKDEE